MPEAFRSNRATNVVLPQPVGPAMIQVKGCFQRGSMSMNELSSGRHILLQFQRCRAETVGEYVALPVDAGKCSFILDVGHHGRITHAEAPVDPITTPAIREHGEKGVFVDDVLPLTQTFRAVFVGLAEEVVGTAAQTNESVTAPFYIEQARGPLVEKPCVRGNTTLWPSTSIRLYGRRRILPRDRRSFRPGAIETCSGSSVRGARK